jgi:hypothetical protein
MTMKKIVLNFAVIVPSLIAAFLFGMRIGERKMQQEGCAVAINRDGDPVNSNMPAFGMMSQIASLPNDDFLKAPTWNHASDASTSLLSYSWDNWARQKEAWNNIKRTIDAYEQSLGDEHRQLEAEREASYCHLNSMNSPIDLIDLRR